MIPHTKHVLENGLEVILHEDHACPVVSVYVYYHVGSSREEPGRSGFAHLFEHMLFQGSQHVDDNGHFRLIQGAGGTLNGTTSADRTNYYQTLPSNQLELALWLESDRMGFLLPAMTQAKLDNQRDVVSNERRQSYENRPYGLLQETILRHLYPPGHPYHWPTIGSMADIAAADLQAVTYFFRRWYGPNNATLVIGGDFDPALAMDWVQGYFGCLPRGPEVLNAAPRAAELAETKRILIEDQVQIPLLSVVWPTVHAWHPDEAALELLLDVLSANKCSVLDATLELGEQLVSAISASQHGAELAGTLTLNLRPNSGVGLDRLLQRLDQLLEQFVREGVSEARIEHLKARRKSGLLHSMETVSQRTQWLGIDNCLSADPGRIRERFEQLERVDLPQVLDVARRYLLQRPRILVSVVPLGQRQLGLVDSEFDDGRLEACQAAPNPALPEPEAFEDPMQRHRMPGAAEAPEFVLPPIWHATLANGLELVGSLADRIPISRLAVHFPAGRLQEPEHKLGLAEFTARLLQEGCGALSSTELIDELDGLGAQLSVAAGEDEIVLSLSVLDEHIQRGVELLNDVIRAPRFAEEDFERIKRQMLVDQEANLDQAGVQASEGFRALLFGAGPKGASALGNPSTVAGITSQEVRAFWHANASFGRARIAYLGGLDKARVRELLAPMGALEPGAASEKSAALPSAQPQSWVPEGKPGILYVKDKPGAQLSELRVGHLGIAQSDPLWFPLFVMNYVLGGSFISRLNLNLREDKGYTYGIRSAFSGALTQGSFVVSTAVETRVTAAALGEVLAELQRIHAGITPEETDYARSSLIQSLLRNFETPAALLAAVQAIGKYGWDDHYPAQRLAWLQEMRAEELSELARQSLFADGIYVMIVGDLKEIEDDLRALNFGQIVTR